MKNMKTALFLTTYDCNQNCLFCLNEWRGREIPKDELALDKKKTALKKLKESGVTHCIFTGGEPLLDDNLEELIDYAHSLGLVTALQTNGVFLSRSFLERVKGKIQSIQISLEGLREEHNFLTRTKTFEHVCDKVLLCKEMGFYTITNFTITKQNFSCLEDYVQLVNELGADQANFTRLYKAGNALINYDSLAISTPLFIIFLKRLALLEKISKARIQLLGAVPLCLLVQNGIDLKNVANCGAGKAEIAIKPNGDLTTCPSNPIAFGNILKTEILNVWQSSPMRKIAKREFANEVCKKCPLFDVCGGGCLICHKLSADPLQPNVAFV